MKDFPHPLTRGARAGFAPLLASLALWLSACGGGGQEATPATSGSEDAGAQAASQAPDAPAQPDLARALQRATERWQAIVAEDWLQVYGFAPKVVRAQMSPQQFLQNTAHHHYENPSKPKVLLTEGDTAFLEIKALWTPTHPQLWQADNADELANRFPEEVDIVEEWRFVDGDWYHFRNHRGDEFLEQHPEVGTRSAAAGGAGEASQDGSPDQEANR